MSIRSNIAILNEDNTVTVVYCHKHGVPQEEGVGNILFHYYKDTETVRKLLSLGDLSQLGNEPISDKDAWEIDDGFSCKFNRCLSYRDRGDKNVDARTIPLSDWEKEISDYVSWADYAYLWKNDHWEYRRPYDKEWTLLSDVYPTPERAREMTIDTLRAFKDEFPDFLKLIKKKAKKDFFGYYLELPAKEIIEPNYVDDYEKVLSFISCLGISEICSADVTYGRFDKKPYYLNYMIEMCFDSDLKKRYYDYIKD